MRVVLRVGAAILAALATGACHEAEGRVEPQRASAAAAGEGGAPVSIDSALTLFRRGLQPTNGLEHGATSIDSLVERLIAAIAASDTAALRSLVMSRREFAYLYYPASPYTRAPTKQEAALAWFLHLQASQKGAARLLRRYDGRRIKLIRNECTTPIRWDTITLWSDCAQLIAEGPDTARMRLFAGVIQHRAVFKVFSFSNDL